VNVGRNPRIGVGEGVGVGPKLMLTVHAARFSTSVIKTAAKNFRKSKKRFIASLKFTGSEAALSD